LHEPRGERLRACALVDGVWPLTMAVAGDAAEPAVSSAGADSDWWQYCVLAVHSPRNCARRITLATSRKYKGDKLHRICLTCKQRLYREKNKARDDAAASLAVQQPMRAIDVACTLVEESFAVGGPPSALCVAAAGPAAAADDRTADDPSSFADNDVLVAASPVEQTISSQDTTAVDSPPVSRAASPVRSDSLATVAVMTLAATHVDSFESETAVDPPMTKKTRAKRSHADAAASTFDEPAWVAEQLQRATTDWRMALRRSVRYLRAHRWVRTCVEPASRCIAEQWWELIRTLQVPHRRGKGEWTTLKVAEDGLAAEQCDQHTITYPKAFVGIVERTDEMLRRLLTDQGPRRRRHGRQVLRCRQARAVAAGREAAACALGHQTD
jgi:hypothetical protein